MPFRRKVKRRTEGPEQSALVWNISPPSPENKETGNTECYLDNESFELVHSQEHNAAMSNPEDLEGSATIERPQLIRSPAMWNLLGGRNKGIDSGPTTVAEEPILNLASGSGQKGDDFHGRPNTPAKDNQDTDEKVTLPKKLKSLELEEALSGSLLKFDPAPSHFLRKYQQLLQSRDAGMLEPSGINHYLALKVVIRRLVIEHFGAFPSAIEPAFETLLSEDTKAKIMRFFEMDSRGVDLFDRTIHEILEERGDEKGYVAVRDMYNPIAVWLGARLEASELDKPDEGALQRAKIVWTLAGLKRDKVHKPTGIGI